MGTQFRISRIQCHDFGKADCCNDCRTEGATFDQSGTPVLFEVRPVRVAGGPKEAYLAEACCIHVGQFAHLGEETWEAADRMRNLRLERA